MTKLALLTSSIMFLVALPAMAKINVCLVNKLDTDGAYLQLNSAAGGLAVLFQDPKAKGLATDITIIATDTTNTHQKIKVDNLLVCTVPPGLAPCSTNDSVLVFGTTDLNQLINGLNKGASKTVSSYTTITVKADRTVSHVSKTTKPSKFCQ